MSFSDKIKENLCLYSKPLGVTTAAAALYFTYCIVTDDKDKKKFKNIPTPGQSYPIVGHAFSLTDMPGKKAYEWHEQLNSPILRIRMGVKNWVLISDPLLAHKVMVVNSKVTSNRPYVTFSKKYYGKGGKGVAFSELGEVWKTSRGALLTILSPKNVALYNDFIEQETKEMVERLVQETKRSGSVDPYNYIALNSMNIVCHVSVGKKYTSFDDPEYKDILYMVEKSLYYAGATFDFPSFFPRLSIFHRLFGIEKKFQDFIVNHRDPLMMKLINEARINTDAPNIIRSLENDYGVLEDDQKIVVLNDVINASIDPVQHAIGWSFAILCNFPEVQEDLNKEIDGFKKEYGRLPTFRDKDKVPLVNSALTECLRFKSPTTFGLPHLVEEDLEIDGFGIPSGSWVLPSFDHMQTSPHFIKNGENIDFKRYVNNTGTLLSTTKGRIENRDLFSFGWGKRSCPGVHLGNVQLFAVFVATFSRCKIEPDVDRNGKPIYPDYINGTNAGVSTKILPYKVRFVQRNN